MNSSQRKENWIKIFFASNAVTSIIILGLITLFLFKEGIEFFGQYRNDLQRYRKSGMEYANVVTKQHDDLTLLYRYLENILSQETAALETLTTDDASRTSAEKHTKQMLELTRDFQNTKELLLIYEKKVVKWAAETKLFLLTQSDMIDVKEEALKQGLPLEDFPETVAQLEERTFFTHKELIRWQNYFIRHQREDLAKRINPIVGTESGTKEAGQITSLTPLIQASAKQQYAEILSKQKIKLSSLLNRYNPNFILPESDKDFTKVKTALTEYLSTVPLYEQRLSEWNPAEPYPLHRAFSGFLLGKDWVTNSARQDWYGVLPLLSGSLLVSMIALALAIPFGVGSAIYVNQVATAREQSIIKPCIEFISAIPSVLIGFFGIAVLGGMVSFVADERLNSLTAGFLLALMTVPTIFTLAEDSLNNVPRALRDASLSLGANRWQTCARVIFPSAITGIISAVLLGFGRVIGETMVVLLCAGNRIAIPDFTSGLGVFAQPVHTMTGIIAQEMGEVEFGSIHYRALFMVGIALFLIALLVNFLSQTIAGRYKANY
ncbi:MAG: phosphate ABC transporter permease subunit PstC [Verrucomicrobia bacterium]|nr:phosphate ABC transporter permease subunit PstC [Verrucomicrobiota bacterium]MDA1078192.1 phosphate ABC transporter permease subunit PstC [Verrucomicrobiota bacterium]